jgi:hypothetical protein
MIERKVCTDDFIYVLTNGKVTSTRVNPDTGHWKCNLKGDDLDGVPLKVTIALDLVENWIICVTVM